MLDQTTLLLDRPRGAPRLDDFTETVETSETTGETRPLTEDEARAWLDGLVPGEKRPTVNALAAAWGWHRSKVGRFLVRLKAEHAAQSGETTGTQPPSPWRTGREAALATKLPLGAADSPLLAADLATLGERDEAKREEEQDVFAVGSSDVVIEEQLKVAVYTNPFDNVVIRAQARYPDEDPVIIVVPENVPALIEALASLYRDLTGKSIQMAA